MHVTATPMVIELPVGEPAHIAVSITNTSSMIDAYDIEAFGLDPAWMTLSPARLSLFPDEVGIVEVTIALPPDVPAGSRTIAVHVRSENDRNEFSLAQVNLDVGMRARTTLRVDPVMITGGKQATFALIVANEGNATLQARPRGEDPEDLLDIMFEPATVVMAPGRREIIEADVRGRRPWFGQPKPRVITFDLGPDTPPAMATFIQRPRIGRWLLSLLGLVTAAAIFAGVLSIVADRLVDESSVDPALLDKALDDPTAGGGDMASMQATPVGGKVVVASTGQGVAGVSVALYDSGNGTVPVSTAATDADGAYTFARVPAGRYRVRITGAGFADQWYKNSVTFADATDIDVVKGEPFTLDDIEIGGRPGGVSGEVVAPDPSGAVARLVRQAVADANASALVDEVTVSADGSFVFEDVPSPAAYQLIISKPGFATVERPVDVGAAEQVEGIKIVLLEGDGTIAGHVSSPFGPLGGVDIVATSGDTTFKTVSLTVDDVGFFALRTLPTPAQYTLTFQKTGFASATRTVDVPAGQPVPELTVSMAPTTGSISGTVSVADGPIGGVTVTITGPDVDMSTTTVSVGNVGTYVFEQLPAPATYTLTFSKEGLQSQTLLEALDGQNANLTGIDERMVPSTAIIRGTVRSTTGASVAGATVELSDGSETRQVLSADDPLGRFEFDAVAPGTYALTASSLGTSPTVRLVNVIAADVEDIPLTLQPQASLFGTVLRLDPQTGQFVPFSGAVVRLYAAAVFPAPPAAALATATAGADGSYSFGALDAPADFVVAVYAAATSQDALDSALVQTQPSAAAQVPTFEIRVVT